MNKIKDYFQHHVWGMGDLPNVQLPLKQKCHKKEKATSLYNGESSTSGVKL